MDTLRPQRCTRTFTAMALYLWPIGRHRETSKSLASWDVNDVGEVSKNNDETIRKHIECYLSGGWQDKWYP